MEDFDLFWASYPRRVGKGDARRVWNKLRPSPAFVQQILAALSWQVLQPSWTKDGGQYIPYPATYLRQERWDDEPMIDPRQVNRQQAVAAADQYHRDRQARFEAQQETKH